LPPSERSIGRCVVSAIALGSLFNSLILSVTGGLIYSYFSALAFAELTPAALSPSAGCAEAPTAESSLKQAA
jgi:hypothetical protein